MMQNTKISTSTVLNSEWSFKYTVMKTFLVTLVGCMIVLLLSAFVVQGIGVKSKQPNIIFIIADDLGWNDVSFHGSPQIPTPNLDALAASGIILNKHYVGPQCTPSRASLLTGMYPTNTGLQHSVIRTGQPSGLPLNFKIMPQYLKQLGYATHLVGKWHLGYFEKEYTPTYRGFDTFFGFWNGLIDYFDYTTYESENFWGIDLHNGTEVVTDTRGKYSVHLFTEKAQEVIRNHNTSQPLFLMLGHNAPHSGNEYQRLQPLPEYVTRMKHIKDDKRRAFAGVVSSLDESIGKVFAALHTKGILDNTIIVFMSDNGAEVEGQTGGHGSNWPLRGSKMSLWEGGVRVSALLWSPLLDLKGSRTSMQMMHVSDWLPTLYSVAGGSQEDLKNMDGINMWEHLLHNLPSPRNEILLNVDPYYKISALIHNDCKIISGLHPKVNRNSWHGPSGRENFSVSSMDDWVWRNKSLVQDILRQTGRWLLKDSDSWRLESSVDCGWTNPPSGNGGCDPQVSPCLFNITEDPCESHNLASERPEVVELLMNRIRELNSTSLEPLKPNIDLKSDPRCHGFAFVSWLDKEYVSEYCGY